MKNSVKSQLPSGYAEMIDVLDKFYKCTGRTEISTGEIISLLGNIGIKNASATSIITRVSGVIIYNIKHGVYTFDTDIVVNKLYVKAFIKSKLLKVESEISELITFDVSSAEIGMIKTVVTNLKKIM